MKHCIQLLLCALLLGTGALRAQIPQMIAYQGRVAAGGVNFHGTGQFKFAIVNGAYGGNPGETAILWSNDGSLGSTDANGVPTAAVNLSCDRGLYSVLLGNTAASMVAVPPAAFAMADVRLRVWFNDGAHGWQQLSPDQRLVSVGYAMMAQSAQTVPDGSISSLKLANGAVTAGKIADNAVTSSMIVNGAVSSSKLGFAAVNSSSILDSSITSADIFDGTIGSADIAAGAITTDKIAAGAVTLNELANDAVTSAKIATATIQNSDLAFNVINTGEIINGGVQTVDLADAAVTTAKLGTGAVGSAQIAAGAVTSTHIAAGAISSSHLSRPPRSGSIASGSLDFAFGVGDFTVTVSPAFNTTPVVTTGLRSSTGIATLQAPWIRSVSASSFSGRLVLPVVLQPVAPVPAVNTGTPVLFQVSSNPAMVWPSPDESGDSLQFMRASTSTGTSWGAPVSLDTYPGGHFGSRSSTGTISSNPAVAYTRESFVAGVTPPSISYYSQLRYVRATSATGSSWGAPVTVDSSSDNVGAFPSLTVVSGNPAIAYCRKNLVTPGLNPIYEHDLKFVRANDANGTSWGAPIFVTTAGDAGSGASLAVVNGNPAIACYDATNGNLLYIRSSNATGTAWNAPVIVQSAGDTGAEPSLIVVSGSPAIAYVDKSAQQVRYVRALDISGTSWGSPVSLGSAAGISEMLVGMQVVGGVPAVGWNTSGGWSYCRAQNATGTGWFPPVQISAAAEGTSFAVIGGVPGIASELPESGLHFLLSQAPPSFTVDWIALEP
jgi:hypothetical protein